MYSEDKLKKIFKDDNFNQLNLIITEGKIDHTYQSSRSRSLVQMACLYASEGCLKVLVNHYSTKILHINLLGFFLSHGANNRRSHQCLQTLLSLQPNVMQTQQLNSHPLYTFIQNNYPNHFKVALPYYHNLDKHYVHLFKTTTHCYKHYATISSISDEEKDSRLLIVKHCLFEIHYKGLFLSKKHTDEYRNITPSLSQLLNEYDMLVEQQMLDLSLQPIENKIQKTPHIKEEKNLIEKQKKKI
jgi:hypothetical protein